MKMECPPRPLAVRPRLRCLALATIVALLAGTGAPGAPGAPTAPAADTSEATFATIRTLDLALARIGDRLARANAPLCDRLEPDLGLLLHTPAQYARDARDSARRYFRLDGPVGVEGVIAGGPGEAAGLRADDTLLAIGPVRLLPADPAASVGPAALIDVRAKIAALPAGQPLVIEGRRDGAARRWTLTPVPACATRFEVAIGTGFAASADGRTVQIGDRFLTTFPEDQIAVVVAHELSHNILHHRARLEAQGVNYGLASGFGRNVRYFRQTELEADILSVSLLANAGYDPAAAVRFWTAFGPRRGGFLVSRTHPAWRDRVAVLTRAIAALGPARPARPAILATRDRPLDGDWQALLRGAGGR